MERGQEEIETIPIPLDQYVTDNFGLIDFMDEANFNQFIDLIRGQNDETQPIHNFNIQDYDCHDHDHDNIGFVCNVDGHLPPPAPPPTEFFDFDVAAANVADFSLLNACQNDPAADEAEVLLNWEESSGSGAGATTTANAPTKKSSNKGDRVRTLVSERRRRGRMKEKLYGLRALVPNITKMDKASIVGDAVLYIQDLQMQSKKLKAEIAAALETTQHPKNMKPTSFYPITNNIFKMDVYEVEERVFYVRIVSNKGKGVAGNLYKALDSLTSFNVQSSNLASSSEKYVFTFTLHQTMEGEMNVNLQNLKMWIAGFFLNHGFEFQTLLHSPSIQTI